MRGSNSRHLRCKRSALPTELITLTEAADSAVCYGGASPFQIKNAPLSRCACFLLVLLENNQEFGVIFTTVPPALSSLRRTLVTITLAFGFSITRVTFILPNGCKFNSSPLLKASPKTANMASMVGLASFFLTPDRATTRSINSFLRSICGSAANGLVGAFTAAPRVVGGVGALTTLVATLVATLAGAFTAALAGAFAATLTGALTVVFFAAPVGFLLLVVAIALSAFLFLIWKQLSAFSGITPQLYSIYLNNVFKIQKGHPLGRPFFQLCSRPLMCGRPRITGFSRQCSLGRCRFFCGLVPFNGNRFGHQCKLDHL